MKSFVPALALAAGVAAEADPQLLVNTSPLLKTIVPQQAVKLIKPAVATTYTAPVATHVAATPITYTAPHVIAPQQVVYTAPQQVQYIKPAEVKIEEQPEEQKKVEIQTYNTAYAVQQPTVYAHQPVYTNPIVYAQPQAAVFPAQKVYQAKNGAVEHTVIQKREAEAEPIDYVTYQTGPLSTKKVPTLKKTLQAYNKYPVGAYALPQQVPYVAAAPQVATHVPYVNAAAYTTYPNVYANQYAVAGTPYQYVF